MKLQACVAAAGLIATLGIWGGPASAQSVMQQCGQQYQAAKAANTLNGKSWNEFRVECSARLKAEPAAKTEAAPATQTAAPAANPLNPAPAAPTAGTTAPASGATAPATTSAAAPTKTPSAGRTAFVARERQCGTEWKANKASLKAQTPGITWPKYLHECNARLKAAGQ